MTEQTLICPPRAPADPDRARRLRRAHRAHCRARRLRGAVRLRRRHRLYAPRAAGHRPRQHERGRADGDADPRSRRCAISSSMPIPATAMRSTCSARCGCSNAPAPTRSRSRTRTFPSAAAISTTRRLVPAQEMAGKIKAAVDARTSRDTLIIARTDAVAVEGFDRALARAALYREAGADVLFVEAPRQHEELGRIGAQTRQIRAADGQHGGGRQDADAAGERTRGARLFPGRSSPAPSCARSPRRRRISTPRLKTHGSTDPFRARMFDFDALNRLIGTAEMLERGKRYAEDEPQGGRTSGRR